MPSYNHTRQKAREGQNDGTTATVAHCIHGMAPLIEAHKKERD